MRSKKCANCGANIGLKPYWKKYCSRKCRWEKWDKDNPRISKELHKLLLKQLKKGGK